MFGIGPNAMNSTLGNAMSASKGATRGWMRPGMRPKQPSVGSLGPRAQTPMAPSPNVVRQQVQANPPVAQTGHLPLVTQPRPEMNADISGGEGNLAVPPQGIAPTPNALEQQIMASKPNAVMGAVSGVGMSGQEMGPQVQPMNPSVSRPMNPAVAEQVRSGLAPSRRMMRRR